MEILHMFNKGRRPLVQSLMSMQSVVESTDSSVDSSTDPARIGVWVRAFRKYVFLSNSEFPND